MSPVYRFSSSLRAEPLAVTLSRAQRVAPELGISRVTDITRLDCIGVPVFASIRPDAHNGSLCVNAGKGLTPSEACVGAYMEAIEFAFAEYNRAGLNVVSAPAQDVLDGHHRPNAILDFCPMMGIEIQLEALIPCVEAADICSQERFLVPAELVFLPCPSFLSDKCYFGSNSNGLSSGNTLLEATVHGLAEVIERDVSSFHAVDDRSMLVPNEMLPPSVRPVANNLAAVGLKLYVRYINNIYNLPFFMATVSEVRNHNPIYINGGFGLNPCRSVALTRAVCEALQSRLSFIHGGRDDLLDRYERTQGWSDRDRLSYSERLLEKASRNGSTIDFDQIEDLSETAQDLDSALEVLLCALAKNGFHRVLRVAYTPPDYPVQVVRILVPGLEFFNETTARIGFRLRDHVRTQL